MSEPVYKDSVKMFDQIDWCNFQCEGGPLAMNTGYHQLKKYVYKLKFDITTVQQELSTVKAERDELLTVLGSFRVQSKWRTVDDAMAELTRLQGVTRWECKCGGVDIEGQVENEKLKADNERLKEDAITLCNYILEQHKMKYGDCACGMCRMCKETLDITGGEK